MSLNLCTDQLVLALMPPQRIVSVNERSRDPGSSVLVAAAAHVAVNHGTAEEVLRTRPDLVIAGSYTTPATRALLKRLGWPLLEVPPADTIAQIRATTRQVAAAVGEGPRAERLLARMEAQLAELARHPGPPLLVAAWDGSGFAAGAGSLYDAVLRLAGAVNIAADPHLARRGAPDTELLLAAAPALLVRGGDDDRDGLRADVVANPLVRRYWGKDRTLAIAPAYYVCGTPFVADEALRLRAKLQAAAAAARTPLPFALNPPKKGRAIAFGGSPPASGRGWGWALSSSSESAKESRKCPPLTPPASGRGTADIVWFRPNAIALPKRAGF